MKTLQEETWDFSLDAVAGKGLILRDRVTMWFFSSFGGILELRCRIQGPHSIPLGRPSAPAPSILYHASNLDWRLVSHDSIHVSMSFSQIIPPSPSPTESKRVFYTSVSLLLSCIQGYCYSLSKFHIYGLVYCIGVFLSGLLHSV